MERRGTRLMQKTRERNVSPSIFVDEQKRFDLKDLENCNRWTVQYFYLLIHRATLLTETWKINPLGSKYPIRDRLMQRS